jgi:integrase
VARKFKRLSARQAETIKKPGYHADGDGLYLVVDKTGARRWAFIFHTRGKRREMGLGRIGLKEARHAAQQARHQVHTGVDPVAARKAARARGATIPTFGDIARKVIADAQSKSTNDKVRYQWDLLLGPAYCGSILQQPINEITTVHVYQLLKPVWQSKPETGRKLLVRLRRVFDYASVHVRETHGVRLERNPADWRDLNNLGLEKPRKLSRGHQPALRHELVPEFFTALRGQQGIAARALEITVLTALRTGEVIGATREEIDLDKKIWTIPIERSKDRKTRTKPHKVPLSPAVIALLKALPKVGQFLFPGLKAGKPLSNMAMAVALKKLNKSESGWRWLDQDSNRQIVPHGFRATFRGWAKRSRQEWDLVEECLGHAVGSAVQRAYDREDTVELRRPIMEEWAKYSLGSSEKNVAHAPLKRDR